MSLAQLLAFLAPMAPMLEKALLNLDQNNLQPWIKEHIAQCSSPDIREFLTAIDGALDAWLQAEAGKLG